MWKTLWIIYNLPSKAMKKGISTGLFNGKLKVFHRFLLKKDINLLILHRK